MQERLQKFIARSGVSSRRKAEKMIAGGLVKVNGETVRDTVIFVDPETDTVEVDGKAINPPEKFTYYAVNKPVGWVSTADDPHTEKPVVDLVPKNPRVYPVGRLDKDSEGLMILTDDGGLTLKITHPRYEHEKEYLVRVQRSRGEKEDFGKYVKKLSEGVDLDSERVIPKLVGIESSDWKSALLRFILTEGKKRQIRRMCSAVGLKVVSLKRVRICRLELRGLKPGEYRRVKKNEIL